MKRVFKVEQVKGGYKITQDNTKAGDFYVEDVKEAVVTEQEGVMLAFTSWVQEGNVNNEPKSLLTGGLNGE